MNKTDGSADESNGKNCVDDAGSGNPELITERLRISHLTPADAGTLFACRSIPEVAEYQSWAPATLQEAADFIAQNQTVVFDTPGTWFQFGVSLTDSGQLIGDMGAHFPRDDVRQAEIGITIAPDYQRQGYAREALTALLGHLLGAARKHRVFASVDPANTASLRLLKKTGMRQEAHFRQSLWFKGRWADDVVFALLASEWATRSTRPYSPESR